MLEQDITTEMKILVRMLDYLSGFDYLIRIYILLNLTLC